MNDPQTPARILNRLDWPQDCPHCAAMAHNQPPMTSALEEGRRNHEQVLQEFVDNYDPA
jgi:hypothetical protein